MEDKQAFSKVIRLLHSKHKDSEVQLLQLVDDQIQKKYGQGKSVMKLLKEKPRLFCKDHVPSFLRGDAHDDRTQDSDCSEPPLYVDLTCNSPGVISIPDEPSSSLLELEQRFEASISGLEDVVGTSVAGVVDTGKSHKVAGGGRKKKQLGSKEQVSVLDEVMALMDKSVGKKVVDGGGPPLLCEGYTQFPCGLCSDGKIAKAVACRRCKQTFLVCCVTVSSAGFDPRLWCCDECVKKRTAVACGGDFPADPPPTTSRKGPDQTEDKTSKPQRRPTSSRGDFTVEPSSRKGLDLTGDKTSKCQKRPTSSVKPKGEQQSGSCGTHSKKALNFEKKLKIIKHSK